MAYDYPYRLEQVRKTGGEIVWSIMRTGDDPLCTGSDHYELRKMVDALNEMAEVYATEGR